MKKSTKMFKRFFTLLLVVLMSIESIGAVVSDNDGSAFITKAEFDSLKNNFQSQIDQYNTSIDSKIDGAIASYLAGINVAKTEQKSILTKNWDKYTMMNGHIDNEWCYPNISTQLSAFMYRSVTLAGDYSYNKVVWANSSMSYVRDSDLRHNKRVLVDDVVVDSSGNINSNNMTWKGIASNCLESWNMSGQMTNYNEIDPDGLSTNADLMLQKPFNIEGAGVLKNLNNLTNRKWQPLWYWKIGSGSTSSSWHGIAPGWLSITQNPTISYEKDGNNKTYLYEHIGNWKENEAWEVTMYQNANYMEYSPNNTLRTSAWVSAATKTGLWSGEEGSYVISTNRADVFNRNTIVHGKNVLFSDGSGAGGTTTNDAQIPTLGLLPNTYNAYQIYQYSSNELVDDDGNNITPIALQQGLVLCQVKEDEIVEWDAVFDNCTVSDYAGNQNIVVVLSYKPFTNNIATYYNPGTQDVNDYVEIEGFERGVSWPVTNNNRVKIKFTSDRDGYIYVKWFPNILNTDIYDKFWESTLSLKDCNTYKSTKVNK